MGDLPREVGLFLEAINSRESEGAAHLLHLSVVFLLQIVDHVLLHFVLVSAGQNLRVSLLSLLSTLVNLRKLFWRWVSIGSSS